MSTNPCGHSSHFYCFYDNTLGWLVIFVCLSSLPVAHLSDALRRRLVVRGIVQGYRTKLLRIPPGSLTCSVYDTVTRDLVSSKRLLIIFSWPAGYSKPQPVETRNIVFTASPTLYLLS